MYTLSVVIISVISLVFRLDIFLQVSAVSQILVVVGAMLQVGLLVFFFLVLKHEKLLHNMCSGVLRFLAKLRILKFLDEKQRQLDAYMDNYRVQAKMITEHPKAMMRCFLLNFLQRSCQIAVTMFVYMATAGKTLGDMLELWFRQSYVVMGSNSIPIPGAMGISDYMLVSAFSAIGFTSAQALNLNLASRGVSFYLSVILCGLSMVIRIISYKVGAKMQEKKATQSKK
jgi:uncharacterized membrane protein YbhN (UPF0104 family)